MGQAAALGEEEAKRVLSKANEKIRDWLKTDIPVRVSVCYSYSYNYSYSYSYLQIRTGSRQISP